VTGYVVYRNDLPLVTTTNLSFVDTTVEPETKYTYTVRAEDAASNQSSPSKAVTVTSSGTGSTTDPVVGSLVSNLTVANGTSYELDTLASGKTVYIDRAYTYTTIPLALDGHTYIRTANNDKVGSGAKFLTFEVATAVTVYVLMDSRATQVPGWLGAGSWMVEPGSVEIANNPHVIYSKAFPVGQVALGGNGDSPMSGAGSMYTVVIDSN